MRECRVCEGERESACVCVCVCVREREVFQRLRLAMCGVYTSSYLCQVCEGERESVQGVRESVRESACKRKGEKDVNARFVAFLELFVDTGAK